MWNFIQQYWLTWLIPQTVRLQDAVKETGPRPWKVAYLTTPFGFGVGVYPPSLKTAALWSNASACTWLLRLVLKSPTLWEDRRSVIHPVSLKDRHGCLDEFKGLLWRQQKRTGWGEAIQDLSPSWLDRRSSLLSLQPQLNKCCTNMFFSRHLEEKNVKEIGFIRSGWRSSMLMKI